MDLGVGGELAYVPNQSEFRFLSTSVIIHHNCMFYPAIEKDTGLQGNGSDLLCFLSY